MSVFIKRFVGFSIGPIIGAIISFLTVPITTYFIAPEEFGKANMISVVQTMILSFIYLGLDQAYTREYHIESNKKVLFQNALFLPLISSILISFVMIIFQRQTSIFLFDSPQYGYVTIFFSFTIISMVIERFILLSIRMEERTIEYSSFNILIKLSILILTIVFLLLGDRNFLSVVYATIFGQLISDLILCIKYRRLFLFDKEFINQTLIKKMLKFGLPLIIASTVSSLLNTSGRFFLRHYSTYEDIGIYTAGLKVSGLITIAQVAFTTFWVPTAYRWFKEEKSFKHFKAVSDTVLLLLTIFLFILLLFKDIIIKILSPEYAQAALCIGLLSLVPILYTLSETTTLGIVFSGKSVLNLWVSIISLIPNIFLNLLLVPKLGVIGASMATGISYLFFYYFRTYFSSKQGFNMLYKKQVFSVLILTSASIINSVDLGKINLLITIILFIFILFLQIDTIKNIYLIWKNPNDWDFS